MKLKKQISVLHDVEAKLWTQLWRHLEPDLACTVRATFEIKNQGFLENDLARCISQILKDGLFDEN